MVAKTYEKTIKKIVEYFENGKYVLACKVWKKDLSSKDRKRALLHDLIITSIEVARCMVYVEKKNDKSVGNKSKEYTAFCNEICILVDDLNIPYDRVHMYVSCINSIDPYSCLLGALLYSLSQHNDKGGDNGSEYGNGYVYTTLVFPHLFLHANEKPDFVYLEGFHVQHDEQDMYETICKRLSSKDLCLFKTHVLDFLPCGGSVANATDPPARFIEYVVFLLACVWRIKHNNEYEHRYKFDIPQVILNTAGSIFAEYISPEVMIDFLQDGFPLSKSVTARDAIGQIFLQNKAHVLLQYICRIDHAFLTHNGLLYKPVIQSVLFCAFESLRFLNVHYMNICAQESDPQMTSVLTDSGLLEKPRDYIHIEEEIDHYCEYLFDVDNSTLFPYSFVWFMLYTTYGNVHPYIERKLLAFTQSLSSTQRTYILEHMECDNYTTNDLSTIHDILTRKKRKLLCRLSDPVGA